MTDLLRPHQADGDELVLTAVHMAGGDDLTDIMTLRWTDRSGHEGQDSRVRLVKHIEQGGRLFVEQAGTRSELEIFLVDESSYLRTSEVTSATDPLLRLPRF